MEGARAPTSRGARVLLGLALTAAVVAGGVALTVVLGWRDALRPELGAGFWALVLALGLGTIAGPAAFLRRPRAPIGFLLRATLVALVVAQIVALALFPSFREPYVASLVALALGFVACLACLPLPPLARWPRVLRGLELSAFAVALAVIAAELGLHAVEALAHPALLVASTSTRGWIRTHGLPPGLVRFGFPVNSRGDYDVEPPHPGSAPLVVVIGDSFSPGTVAHSLHYTSVAERILRAEIPGLEVYNMGIPGADPSHYLELLVHDALPMLPQVVVIALFVGNDLDFAEPEEDRPVGFLAALFDRERDLGARFVVRSLRILAEQRRSREEGAAGGSLQGENDVRAIDPAAALAEFPWMADPSLEKPTFSSKAFADFERERARAITTGDEHTCLPWLLKMRDAARNAPAPAKLLVMLIPDELQVEDDVWELARPQDPGADRDRAQRVLARFLSDAGVECLDLLPAFRAAMPLADGRKHLYHLRDSHWNARGNELGGQELARRLRALLE